jgi:hypothetical protein
MVDFMGTHGAIREIHELHNEEVDMYKAIIAEVKRYNSKIYDQAISNVKASGQHCDSLFKDIVEE